MVYRSNHSANTIGSTHCKRKSVIPPLLLSTLLRLQRVIIEKP